MLDILVLVKIWKIIRNLYNVLSFENEKGTIHFLRQGLIIFSNNLVAKMQFQFEGKNWSIFFDQNFSIKHIFRSKFFQVIRWLFSNLKLNIVDWTSVNESDKRIRRNGFRTTYEIFWISLKKFQILVNFFQVTFIGNL